MESGHVCCLWAAALLLLLLTIEVECVVFAVNVLYVRMGHDSPEQRGPSQTSYSDISDSISI